MAGTAFTSRSGVKPQGSKTITAFWNAAQVNGEHFGLESYDHRKLMVMLNLMQYANPNCQTNIGYGVGGSAGKDLWATAANLLTGATKSLGDACGKIDIEVVKDDIVGVDCSRVSLFGIEDAWGWLWEMSQNIYCGNSANDDQDGTEVYIYEGNRLPSASELATHPEGDFRHLTRPTSSGYVSKMTLGQYFDIIVQTLGGGSTSYWCDYFYGNATGQLVLWGGVAVLGSIAGLGCAYSSYAFSYSSAIIGSRLDDFHLYEAENGTQPFVTANRTYLPLASASGRVEFVTFAEGADQTAKMICTMASVAFNEAKNNYEEKHNKAAFVKNIISDNILPGDVYVRAKELHFVTDEVRSVILVRQSDSSDGAAVEVVQRLFPDKQNDFVININETDIAVIKSVPHAEDSEEARKAANMIEKALRDELGVRCVIGISTNAHHLRELADRYKEAQVAIDVGKVFEEGKTVICYESLGLGRIIYQLPTTLCEMFLNEVFKKNPIETLDEDTLETINKFFENNLNVSETSRKLYVHRNTLVYRLEKIKKLTGLDLREFAHAIVFKVAMMVKKYLDSLSTSKY